MIGQDTLLNSLHSFSLETLPHTILLVGESGCGKHTLAQELANSYNLPLHDITENLSYDLIVNLQINSCESFYLINLQGLTEKEQNIILKFIEEPSKNSYVILISASEQGILDTVKNRCMIYRFSLYPQNILAQFLVEGESRDILRYCSTPGQIKNAHENMEGLIKLCDTIVTSLKTSRYDNALSIVNKINYKDNYDKFNLDIFFNVLLDKLSTDYITNKNITSLKLYNMVRDYKARLMDTRINKEILMENLVTNMWKEAR